ncbi:unnamed protein product [Cunninghamella blakesleeana]
MIALNGRMMPLKSILPAMIPILKKVKKDINPPTITTSNNFNHYGSGDINYNSNYRESINMHNCDNNYKNDDLNVIKSHNDKTQQQEEVEEQEEDQDSNDVNTIEKNSSSDELDAELNLPTNVTSITNQIPPPNSDDHYILNEFDISQAFYNFQLSVLNYIKSNTLCIETQAHHIFALSSILLLKKNRMHTDVKKYINNNHMNNIMNDLYQKLDMNLKFSNSNMLTMMELAKDVYQENITRIDASLELLKLAKSVDDIDKKIILSINRLIQDLPMNIIMDPIKETELCTRYIQPAIQPLFDDHEKNILFKWFGVQNPECKNSNISVSRRRPDCIISIIEDNYEKASIGYGEVKQQSEASNHHSINKDLIRLGIFSKNSIDINNVKGVLSMHIVGQNITFYLTKLLYDGLYTMIELTNFNLPLSIDDLPGYLTNLDKVKNVLHVFNNECNIMGLEHNIRINKVRSRPSMSTPEFERVIDKKINRKRKNITSHYRC